MNIIYQFPCLNVYAIPVNTHTHFKSAPQRHQKLIKCVLILLFIFSLSAKAQVFHIDTIGCQIEESDTSYLNKMVRHEVAFYNQVFGTHKNDTAAINISLYGNVKAYTKVLKLNKFKVFTNGVYSAELNRSFVYKNDIYMHVILHAVSNYLLHNNYPDAPRWLTEGISAVMSHTDETGDRKIVYTPLLPYNKLVKDFMWQTDLGLDYIFMADNPDWNSKSITTLRAVSYGVIYFLISRDKDYLTPILSSMKQGHTATEAIESCFGSFDEFKNQFTIYYRYAEGSKTR